MKPSRHAGTGQIACSSTADGVNQWHRRRLLSSHRRTHAARRHDTCACVHGSCRCRPPRSHRVHHPTRASAAVCLNPCPLFHTPSFHSTEHLSPPSLLFSNQPEGATRYNTPEIVQGGKKKSLLPPHHPNQETVVVTLTVTGSLHSAHSHSLSPAPSVSGRPRRGHGREQQHHGVPQLPGPNLHHPGGRHGPLVRLQAGRRVRAPGALARGHPRRAAPARRPRRLRRRLLEPPGPPGRLPLRHGRPHHAPPGAPRLRLRRHPRLRRVRRARPRLPRVPPRGLLRLAARVRCRGSAAVGGHPGVPRRVGHLQEAHRGGRLLHRPRAVLPVRPLAAPVRLLQAADGVRVRVRVPDGVGEPGEPGGGRGLRRLEQRPAAALLLVQLLQGRHAGHPARPVAPGQRRARRRHRRAPRRLRHRLQRLQERADRGPLPPLQVEQQHLILILYVH